MELTEVKRGKISCGTRCRAGAAAYATLQLGELGDDIATLSQVVIVEVYRSRTTYVITKIYSHLY